MKEKWNDKTSISSQDLNIIMNWIFSNSLNQKLSIQTLTCKKCGKNKNFNKKNDDTKNIQPFNTTITFYEHIYSVNISTQILIAD